MAAMHLPILLTFILLSIPACFGKYQFTSRIVGGSEVDHGIYPFFVKVYQGGKFRCGGTLIGAQWVVTAAHCFRNRHDKVEVSLEQTTQKIYEAETFWIHEDFHYKRNPRGKEEGGVFNDIGLIRLKSPIERASSLRMNEDYNWPPNETPLTVIGVGDMDPDSHKQRSAEALLKTTMNVYPSDDCIFDYNSYLTIESEQMICAQGRNTSPCKGDSGGPLFDEERQLLVGIVSFGEPYRGAGCYSTYPAVFVRVSNYVDWIQDIMNRFRDTSQQASPMDITPKAFESTKTTSSSSSLFVSGNFALLIMLSIIGF